MEIENNQVEWTKPSILCLIDMWKGHEVLYDPNHKFYHNRLARRKVLCELVNKLKQYMPNISPIEVNDKIHYLRGQYTRELVKQKAARDAGDEGACITSWSYIEKLSFLKPFIRGRAEKNGKSKAGDTLNPLQRKKNPSRSVKSKRKNEAHTNLDMDCHSSSSTTNVRTVILPKQQVSPLESSKKGPHACDVEQSHANSQQSGANELISALTDALDTITPKKSCDQDEAFCNFLKVELSQLRPEIKDELKEEISLMLFKAKKKQRTSTYQKLKDESIVVELYR